MPPKADELHQEASALCIKADFDNAMSLWRQMLELAPDDERAIEGIRLCEKLQAGEPLEQPAPPAPAPAADPVPESAAEQPPMENLGEAIDNALFGSVEVSDEPQAFEAIPAPAAVPPADSASELSVDQEAANELRRRVRELMEEAQDFADTGNLAEAEQTLTRVLILDEENEQALALQNKIQQDAPAEAPNSDGETTGVEFDLTDEAEDGPEESDGILSLDALSPVEPAPLDLVPQELDGGVSDLPSDPADALPFDPTAEFGAAAEADAGPPPDVATAPASSGKHSSRAGSSRPSWTRDRRVLLGVGGILLVLAVVFGMGFIGGGQEASVEPLVVAVKKARQQTATEKDPAAADAAKPPAAAAKPPQQLLAEANAAVEEEDWGGAVLAYNALLEQQPDHAEALAGLPIAIEQYRAAEEARQEWEEMEAAFAAENYREALRLMYHMDEERAEPLDEYKFKGWYNLGIVDLRRNRCSDALDHFDDALELRPGDRSVLRGMSIADACLDAGKPTAEARTLQFRLLED